MVSISHPAPHESSAELLSDLLLRASETDLPRLAAAFSDPDLAATLGQEHLQQLEQLKCWLIDLRAVLIAPDASTTAETREALERASRRIGGTRKWIMSGVAALVIASSLMAAGIAWVVSSQRHETRLGYLEQMVQELTDSTTAIAFSLSRQQENR